MPSTFQGSTSGTLVTLGVGPYKANEELQTSFGLIAEFTGDCTQTFPKTGSQEATGTISAGQHLTCTFTNTEQEA